MQIPLYIRNKYGMADRSEVPTEFLCDELLISEAEALMLVKRILKRRGHPEWIQFRDFVQVIVVCLSNTEHSLQYSESI